MKKNQILFDARENPTNLQEINSLNYDFIYNLIRHTL